MCFGGEGGGGWDATHHGKRAHAYDDRGRDNSHGYVQDSCGWRWQLLGACAARWHPCNAWCHHGGAAAAASPPNAELARAPDTISVYVTGKIHDMCVSGVICARDVSACQRPSSCGQPHTAAVRTSVDEARTCANTMSNKRNTLISRHYVVQ